MSGTKEDKKGPRLLGGERPQLLQPPATIVSPPSPTDLKQNHPDIVGDRPEIPTLDTSAVADDEDEPVTFESPVSDTEEETLPAASTSGEVPSPRSISRQTSVDSQTKALADTHLSTSPQPESSLLKPQHTPNAQGSSPFSSYPSSYPSSRSVSPSSPQFRMKGLHHRRTSSTHRVRETTTGEQTSLPDGERMVNQYKIGKGLGRGGYAKVELAIDVGTGKEYAIKEFSKSRLHLQALQDKHKRTARGRAKRFRGSPRPPDDDGKRKAGDDPTSPEGDSPQLEASSGALTTEKDPLALIRREIAVMKKLDHPHLVSLYEAISVPNADSLFLVLEYMPGGVLMEVKMGHHAKDAKPPFPQSLAREYFRQLILGLEYLHANEVIHRDVKPDNILLSADRQTVKLCDFGVSEMFVNQGDDRVKREGGSPAFLSPESFTSQIHEIHGKAVDIWGFGVTLYCMLTGTLPFNVENPIDLIKVVQNDEPIMHPDWSELLQDLIRRMLDKNPSTRIDIDGLRDHAWVTANGTEPMISREENLYYLGSQVEEPTQHELSMAFSSLRSVFTVVRAVQKFKRLGTHSRSSSSSNTPTVPSNLSTHFDPSSMTSPFASTNVSLNSGSMDSYASQPYSGNGTVISDSTSATDVEEHLRTTSPHPMSTKDSSRSGTERAETDSVRRVPPIDTKGEARGSVEDDQEDDDAVVICDSPTSE